MNGALLVLWTTGKIDKPRLLRIKKNFLVGYKIHKNLNTALMRRNINMDFTSAGELDKLPQNKQEQVYQLAQKMAEQDRKLFPSSRLIAKAVKKIQNDPTATIPLSNDESSDFESEEEAIRAWNKRD